jgi:hypothetical protein
MFEFHHFQKIPRYSRDIVVTEKIDGSNAQVHIEPTFPDHSDPYCIEILPYERWENHVESVGIYAGSRNRWITPEHDNFGFAAWVRGHAKELIDGLGIGTHYGEWWGAGIQRRYGLADKRFSLFNTGRWYDPRHTYEEDQGNRSPAPDCCHVVPILYQGPHSTQAVEDVLTKLRLHGSFAAPDFMDPEGVIIYHTAGGYYFKKTLKDDSHKGHV